VRPAPGACDLVAGYHAVVPAVGIGQQDLPVIFQKILRSVAAPVERKVEDVIRKFRTPKSSSLQMHSYRVQRSVQISLPNIRCAFLEKLFACSLYGGAKSSHAQKWLSSSEETPNPEYPEGLAYEVEIDSPWHAQLV
jgi:hypothetical protein